MNHIKKVTISKLFGELDINWHLDPKVNILIGKNGSGKTTLLRLIKNFLMSSPGVFLASGIDAIRIEMAENKYIYASKDSEALSQLQANKPVKSLRHALEKPPVNEVYRVESNLFPPENPEVINLCYINTFEMSLENFDISESHKASGVDTELDVVLAHLINDWKSYLLTLKNLETEVTVSFDEKIRQLSSKASADANDLQELKTLLNEKTTKIDDINFYKNRFIEQINALFSDSKKRLDFDKNNAIIFRTHPDKSLSVYELSSGEKQMLIILLNVLLQENQPSIILMDEPEISLHLAWQLELIDIIQSLNENCQLIIVTHAAGVFNKGWKDKITKMENITTR
jgi:ABC-type cobalamin/Fe3+-siderophores transport system ATPase subunit